MRRPNLFIVGAPRCGTTSMWSYLGSHPEIFMSKQKEPHFFCLDLKFADSPEPPLEEYLRHFAPASGQKKVGEASPDYLLSAVAPRAIKEFSPAAQIIIMLRNPLDVMHSLHSETFNTGEPIADFEAALEADTRRTGRQLIGYRQFTDYPEQVQRYLDTFGRDNVHIVIFDDLKENSARVYRAVLGFLGVDPTFIGKFTIRSASERVRSKRLMQLFLNPPRGVRLMGRALIPARSRAGVRRVLVNSNRTAMTRPPMDPVLRRRLQAEFAPKIEHLSTLLNRDLSGWCKV
ncbi:MAG: sulfotransferase [Acidobacteriota bacterium]|nr:sulfotransferase [Acidobacteriota bacterium]